MATVVPAKIETSQKLPEQSNYNGLPRGDHLESGRRSGDMAQLVPHRVWRLSIGKDIVQRCPGRARSCNPTPGSPPPGSSARKKSPHNIWL